MIKKHWLWFISSISQANKLKPRQIKWLTQDHTTGSKLSQEKEQNQKNLGKYPKASKGKAKATLRQSIVSKIPKSAEKGLGATGGNSLAIISMVGHRVRQPARLVIQAIVLRDQSHSNGAPDPTVHNRHLEGGEQGTVSTEWSRHAKGWGSKSQEAGHQRERTPRGRTGESGGPLYHNYLVISKLWKKIGDGVDAGLGLGCEKRYGSNST